MHAWWEGVLVVVLTSFAGKGEWFSEKACGGAVWWEYVEVCVGFVLAIHYLVYVCWDCMEVCRVWYWQDINLFMCGGSVWWCMM